MTTIDTTPTPTTETLRVRAANPEQPVHMVDAGGHHAMPRRLDEAGRDVNVIRDEPVTVPNVLYYRKRLASGELVLVDDE